MKKPYKIYAEVLEDEALKQFNNAMMLNCTIRGALMPDAHTGYTLPIGCVWKTNKKVFPAAVGYDIGCGMSAIKTDINISTLSHEELIIIKEKIIDSIPLGREVHKLEQILPRTYSYSSKVAKDAFLNLANKQLGTLGGGNHFIEIGEDNDGFLNIVIHSGSRGVGKKIADFYMKMASIEDSDTEEFVKEFENKNTWKDKNPIGWEKAKKLFLEKKLSKINIEGLYGFDISSSYGKSYIIDLENALQFALDNREKMINTILSILEKTLNKRIKTSRFINRNHNHAEIKNDGTVIHRKGATHAEVGMMGVIPGNMKDGSFIVKGKGNIDSMCSSSHGAGRVLSRRKAKETLSVTEFHKEMESVVTNHSDETVDESPKAYKNIYEVMDLQKDLVEVIDKVKPIINIKG